ncbi:MAG: phenylalanine--tRNA ligase subunit beta [Candidatus Taylorbacteria bacterium]|nr:phenylalanine--tRNA ligase subunit beta [Candidatus Taylorbacteria bacterium]
MKISYNWLQSYFKEKLPTPEKVGERLTLLSFEMEGVEKIGDDTVLDLKVLPDRACYALSHRGIAYELGAGLELETIVPKWQKTAVSSGATLPEIKVEANEICTHFAGRRITDLKNGLSPKWMQDFLATLGQRSVSAIVDVTNFVMFDIGRPMHAFDAKKVKGPIVVRSAKAGETMTTLDNKELKLDSSIFVLADDDGPLALAGIKGGNRAGVTEETTEVILEAANWNPTYIRKISQKLGIRTDASKRFENRVPPLYAAESVQVATSMIVEYAGTNNTKASEMILIDIPNNAPRLLSVSAHTIISRIGFSVAVPEILSALKRLGIEGGEKNGTLELTVPHFRLDLTIPEDIVEEVARVIGYDKIQSVVPPNSNVTEIPTSFYYEWKIRECLVNAGFSEVMTSSFYEKGSVAIEKPLAEDKKYARENLRGGFEKALKVNVLNAPLLGDDKTCIFEIGRIFTKDGERTALALGVAGPKKKIVGILESGIKTVSDALGVSVTGENKDGVFECVLDGVFEKLSEPTKWDISIPSPQTEKFTSFSLFPFIARDVALFVSPETTPESVGKILKENAGSLVVRGPELFDEFSKDGKKSLAFRLIFQSSEKTLTDEEVNGFMEKIYSAVKDEGWEVR